MTASKHLLMLSLLASTPCLFATQNNRSFGDCFSPATSAKVTARVRLGNSFCAQEMDTLKKRKTVSLRSLEHFMGTSINPATMPTIGMVCSGGGIRAAIATLGLLRGLEKINLLDAVHYVSGLSGSTWGLSSWLSHTMTLDQFSTFFKKRLDGALTFKNMNEDAILKAVFNKAKTTRSASFSDLWGSILADLLFVDKKTSGQEHYLSEFAYKIKAGGYPFPIFTSVIGETNSDYQWVEFSPFEIGSTYLNAWIPTTAFGKKFNAGSCYDLRPEEQMGYMVGLFGSAYAVSASDAIRLINEKLTETYHIGFPASLITALSAGDNNRLVCAEENNFAFHLKNTPLAHEEKLTFIDAGFGFNFPFPPLMRRNVSVYIVCDATEDSDSEDGNDMHLVEAYARKNNIKLPHINYKVLTQNPISIWADADPQTPIIIFIKNLHGFSSLKFNYSSTEFDLVFKGMEQTVVKNALAIKEAIQKAITKLS